MTKVAGYLITSLLIAALMLLGMAYTATYRGVTFVEGCSAFSAFYHNSSLMICVGDDKVSIDSKNMY